MADSRLKIARQMGYTLSAWSEVELALTHLFDAYTDMEYAKGYIIMSTTSFGWQLRAGAR